MQTPKSFLCDYQAWMWTRDDRSHWLKKGKYLTKERRDASRLWHKCTLWSYTSQNETTSHWSNGEIYSGSCRCWRPFRTLLCTLMNQLMTSWTICIRWQANAVSSMVQTLQSNTKYNIAWPWCEIIMASRNCLILSGAKAIYESKLISDVKVQKGKKSSGKAFVSECNFCTRQYTPGKANYPVAMMMYTNCNKTGYWAPKWLKNKADH